MKEIFLIIFDLSTAKGMMVKMRRLLNLFIYEFKFTKNNWLFHLFALLFPILYLLVFNSILSNDITLPVKIENPVTVEERALFHMMEKIQNPGGIAYWDVEAAPGKDSFIRYPGPILNKEGDKEQLNIILNYEITNTNLIKNYRNRAVKGLRDFLESNYLHSRSIKVKEKPFYESDISWIGFMGMTIMVMGMIISGIFIGGTSLAAQIEEHVMGEYILSPLSNKIIIAVKLLALSIKTILSTFIYIITFYLLCSILPVNTLDLIIIVIIFSVFTTTVGMIVGFLTGSTLLTFITGLILSLGSWIIGGGFGTISFYPGIITKLDYLNPAFYVIKLSKYIYFKEGFSLQGFELCMVLLFTATAILLFSFFYRKAYKWGVE